MPNPYGLNSQRAAMNNPIPLGQNLLEAKPKVRPKTNIGGATRPCDYEWHMNHTAGVAKKKRK